MDRALEIIGPHIIGPLNKHLDGVGSKTAKLCLEEDFFIPGRFHENERGKIEA